MTTTTRGTLSILCLLGAAMPALAQGASSDRLLNEAGRCRAITEVAPRLACFEQVFDKLEAAVKSKDVTIVDRQDVRAARRSLFGFTLPRINLFGSAAPGSGAAGRATEVDDFEEINTTVASAHPVDRGRVEIELADETAAVWRTTDPMPFPPRRGAKIRIRRGALGNYFLYVDSKTYRGMRLR